MCSWWVVILLVLFDDTITAVRNGQIIIDEFHKHHSQQINADIHFTKEIEENGKNN